MAGGGTEACRGRRRAAARARPAAAAGVRGGEGSGGGGAVGVPRVGAAVGVPAHPRRGDGGRGLHSSTFQLNLSRF